jgi:hypothetical protein
MKLRKIPKPEGELVRSKEPPIIAHGQVVLGYYDEKEQYYEYNKTTDTWYRLAFV